MTLAAQLSEYTISLSFKDLDQKTVLEAKKRLLDALGCAIGAFREKPIRETLRVIGENYPSGACSIIGTRKRTSPDMATFANGAMIRYFDFNDTYLSKEPAHPSDNISSCLAIAQMKRLSGKDLLLSIALAYEIQCRLCDAASIRSRGWDHVCYGLVSSALASGKLLDLEQQQLENALNIALNSHIAMRQVRAGELSDWKGFSFANASRNAVFSMLLARAGITGPFPIFEGEMGFFKQVSGEFHLDIEGFGGRSGSFKLPETYIKFFPAEYHAQTAIWAALEIRNEIKKEESKIDSVEVETHEAGYNILGKDREKWAPKTKETADHSLPYMVAVALLDGTVNNSSYSQRKLSNPDILALLPKISVNEDAQFTLEYPNKIANRIKVKLSNGHSITKQVEVPKGHPANPVTQEEIEQKFSSLTGKLLKRSQIERIFEFVWNVEKQRDISLLLDLCAFGS
jgi:2-methylcitrate dehydratase